jgi:DNA-binding NarL/FixJ family response regulator
MLKACKMIIEDDQETAALIAGELVDRGFAVGVAHNGREGLAANLRQTPGLVLCDLGMPFISGFTLLERLTKIVPGFGYMPFVFLTALTDREKELKARRIGPDDYVTKLVDFDVLVAMVNARRARAVNERAPRNVTRAKPFKLNECEVETLTWAARGKTSAQIAQILGLTKRTVDYYIDNARRKLGAATRTQAAIKAKNGQLIEP